MANSKLLDELRDKLRFFEPKKLSWEDAPGTAEQPLDLARADLSDADLEGAVLLNANLREANLVNVNMVGAQLFMADLTGVDAFEGSFTDASLEVALLNEANLENACLDSVGMSGAVLDDAVLNRCSARDVDFSNVMAKRTQCNSLAAEGSNFQGANLTDACLDHANLVACDFRNADLCGASLRGAHLEHANLHGAKLIGANLSGANLSKASLVQTDLSDATLDACRIYGVGVWGAKLDNTRQRDLIITPEGEPEVTVDSLPVAQFVYLLLNNAQIRDVIDSVASKGVLILGRFGEHKDNLESIREKLRELGYLPILFDFDRPAFSDYTETIRTLAGISRFIVADLTAPSSLPQELQAIVPNLKVPVRTIIQGDEREYAMSSDLEKYPWMIKRPFRYRDREHLLDEFQSNVVGVAESRLQLLEELE